jgi:hypothetical protein
MENVLGLAAGLVGLVGYAPYVRDIIRCETRPDRVAWLIWSVQYSLLFATQITTGNTTVLWLPGLQLAGVVLICCLSIRYGEGGWTRQSLCLMACVIGALVVWYFTNNAIAALGISIAIEAIGIMRIAYKAYKDPSSETLTLWLCVGVAGICGVLALGQDAIVSLYLYPVALVLMNFSVVLAWIAGSIGDYANQARLSVLMLLPHSKIEPAEDAVLI